jgi:hypothetical protein
MTSAPDCPSYHYLDATDLADILGISPRTITLRAKRRPWLLPPRATVYDHDLFRWRQDVVESWLAENLSESVKF